MSRNVKFTEEQLGAINEIDHNLLIIACAGSGKTEVITRRIANILKTKKDILPENIVAFTFTEKAATSMKSRIERTLNEEVVSYDIEEMYVGTIHSFCYELLNRYTEKFKDFKILDEVKSYLFVKRYEKECGIKELNLNTYSRDIHMFSNCREKLLDDYDNCASWEYKNKKAIDDYIDCLYKHNYLDFSLLIFETIRQIRENPMVKEYLSSIKYLIVDEYQDINDMQEQLIQSIVDAGANICVVGDDDQTIYQFRGSNGRNMTTFADRYEYVRQIRLEKNFRCSKGITDVARCVIKNNSYRLEKTMVSSSDTIGDVVALRFESDMEQYEDIASRIRVLHEKGEKYSEIAILVRKSKHIKHIAKVLEKNAIPCTYGSVEGFFESDIFSLFMSVLRMMEELNKAELYNHWKDVIGDDEFTKGFKYLRSCSRNGGNANIASLSSILQGFCEITGFVNQDESCSYEHKRALEAISKMLDDYDEIYGDYQLSARVSRVIDFLSRDAITEYKHFKFDKSEDKDAVQIMTVHQSKGLEFNTVFLVKLEEKEFPVFVSGGKKFWQILGGTFESNKEKYETSIDDERNLFYVAVTRAKNSLYMMYQLMKQPVSVFVKEAAKSKYLEIDSNDLLYQPREMRNSLDVVDGKVARSQRNIVRQQSEGDFVQDIMDRCILEEERRIEKERRENAKYARAELRDYYGTGAHFCPAMYAEIARVKEMSDDEVIREAQRHGLI